MVHQLPTYTFVAYGNYLLLLSMVSPETIDRSLTDLTFSVQTVNQQPIPNNFEFAVKISSISVCYFKIVCYTFAFISMAIAK